MPLERSARELSIMAASLDTPAEVLGALDRAVRSEDLHACVAWWLPRRSASVGAYKLGETVFAAHSPEAEAFTAEWFARRTVSMVALLARSSTAPITLGEAQRRLHLTGDDRWIVELFHRNHMRDAVYCPYRNWLLLLWSPTVLQLTPPLRFQISMVGQIAIDRLNYLTREHLKKLQARKLKLTDRELAILTCRSHGLLPREIASKLKISLSSVETYLERARRKLGARDLLHAVAEAVRERLIA